MTWQTCKCLGKHRSSLRAGTPSSRRTAVRRTGSGNVPPATATAAAARLPLWLNKALFSRFSYSRLSRWRPWKRQLWARPSCWCYITLLISGFDPVRVEGVERRLLRINRFFRVSALQFANLVFVAGRHLKTPEFRLQSTENPNSFAGRVCVGPFVPMTPPPTVLNLSPRNR